MPGLHGDEAPGRRRVGDGKPADLLCRRVLYRGLRVARSVQPVHPSLGGVPRQRAKAGWTIPCMSPTSPRRATPTKAGLPTIGPRRGGRALTDGRRWGVAVLLAGRGAGSPALPFFIQDTGPREVRVPDGEARRQPPRHCRDRRRQGADRGCWRPWNSDLRRYSAAGSAIVAPRCNARRCATYSPATGSRSCSRRTTY